MDKIPEGAESLTVLVGGVKFLNQPIVAFVRLAQVKIPSLDSLRTFQNFERGGEGRGGKFYLFCRGSGNVYMYVFNTLCYSNSTAIKLPSPLCQTLFIPRVMKKTVNSQFAK